MAEPSFETRPSGPVGFIGLGRMGTPMAARQAAAGLTVRAHDIDPSARTAFGKAVPDAQLVDTLAAAARGAAAVLLMLPNSDVVESVVGEEGLLEALEPGTVLVDMSSSEPMRTRALAERLSAHGQALVDAPVSGGVSGAHDGTLTIMVGGSEDAATTVRPLLETMGRRVLHVGPVGAGHALKALNNLMSATHLLASSEALLVGQRFGLDPQTMLDVVNGSSGRSGSTDNKWPNHVLPGTFSSGFGIGLMRKDMHIAVDLAEQTGMPAPLGHAAAKLWDQAAAGLPADADHTEIVRWLTATASQYRQDRQ